VVQRVKELEHQGFQFEAAEASFKLLLEVKLGTRRRRARGRGSSSGVEEFAGSGGRA
jgi:2-isopropylmalate synthase